MKKINRRTLLSYMGMSPIALSQCGPIGILLTSFINKTYAQAMGSDFASNLVNIYMSGGPARWMFDLPLNPNGNDPFVQNTTAITSFSESTNRGEYQHIKKGEFFVPRLWDALIPTSNGQTARMDNFLQHMLMIRGVNTGSDGHGVNAIREYQPIAGTLTLSGLLADVSNRPIPATSFKNIPFLSGTGIGMSVIGGRNPILNLLNPFNWKNGRSFNGGASEDLIDQAMSILEKNVDARELKYKSIFKDRLLAKQMFKRQFGDLGEVYSKLTAKYAAIMKDALTDSRFNIGSGVDEGEFLTKGNIAGIPPEYYNLAGIRILGSDYNAVPDGMDLRTTLKESPIITGLVEGFATTEFILKEKLSNAMTIGLGNLYGLAINSSFNNGQSKTVSFGNDSHESGAIPTLYYFSKYYQAMGGCLNELINTLKAQGTFKDTVIRVHGDFNRSAKSDGKGSDHGWNGSCNSFISGKINQNIIIGNCQATTSQNYKGSWGESAPIAELNNREISSGNIIATAATLLGVKNPLKNSDSLVFDEQGVIKTNLGTKNV